MAPSFRVYKPNFFAVTLALKMQLTTDRDSRFRRERVYVGGFAVCIFFRQILYVCLWATTKISCISRRANLRVKSAIVSVNRETPCCAICDKHLFYSAL